MKRGVRIAGVCTVLVGFVTIAFGDRLAGFSTGRVLVTGISVVSILLGLWYVVDRRFREAERVATPDVEGGYRVPIPGDEFDRAVERRGSSREIERRLIERVRVSLAERGASREEAEAAIERGTWTDDPVAAAFLAADGRSVPLTARIRWLLRGDSWYERSVRRTVAALVALEEGPSRD